MMFLSCPHRRSCTVMISMYLAIRPTSCRAVPSHNSSVLSVYESSTNRLNHVAQTA